jgi:hypothetical protein
MAFTSYEEAEIVVVIIICCDLLSFTNPKTKHGFWKRKNFHIIYTIDFAPSELQFHSHFSGCKNWLFLSLYLSQRILALSLSESNPQKWALV